MDVWEDSSLFSMIIATANRNITVPNDDHDTNDNNDDDDDDDDVDDDEHYHNDDNDFNAGRCWR